MLLTLINYFLLNILKNMLELGVGSELILVYIISEEVQVIGLLVQKRFIGLI